MLGKLPFWPGEEGLSQERGKVSAKGIWLFQTGKSREKTGIDFWGTGFCIFTMGKSSVGFTDSLTLSGRKTGKGGGAQPRGDPRGEGDLQNGLK